MSNWKPSSGPGAARRRAALIERARAYFQEENVLAVDTPALSKYAASDPNIESFGVRGQAQRELFLNTSPEFCMKRLLASGYPDIYSICRVFRGGELGRRHAPEFTMVEWYRLDFDLESIIDDTVRFAAACLESPRLARNVTCYDYADAFRKFANIDVFAAKADQLARLCDADTRLESQLGSDVHAWFDLIMSTIVAPQFAKDRLTVVRHYPAGQAALARLCPANEQVADRFELFCGDLELANGYVELRNADEQQRRIDQDLAKRRRTGRPVNPPDEDLIAALASGLPACAGVAAGIERLQMTHDKTDDVKDVVTFLSDTS
jgi:lysyl-tRNA synthetase class 2